MSSDSAKLRPLHPDPGPRLCPLNTVDLRLNRFSGVLSGVRKMLFRKCKNTIFALRIGPEFFN
ncbi:Uncharacterized protein dnm_094380 [Desulfonema magnum]|uniref:Uncharacterized protein n=1 Tax=Desulfonema magnum TaxID=45655 RepID=A0A975BXU0_9BACT|nr:Uncharacterized protein dnm_094380 [Desulfonema magnum]